MNLEAREKQWLLQEKYKGVENEAFVDDLIKLKNGAPLAYLIGNIPFLDTTIDLEYKPLIPRPETEYWVNYVLEKYIQNKSCIILDIFSGSGCIGISIAKKRPLAKIIFSDIKLENILQIKKNCKLNNISDKQIKIIQSDTFKNIPLKKYDYIFANPPYISLQKIHTVQKTVLDHEDHLALFANDDGLFFIKECLEKIQTFLKNKGFMFIEFDPWQKELIDIFLKTKNINYEFVNDQYQKPRLLVIQNKKPHTM